MMCSQAGQIVIVVFIGELLSLSVCVCAAPHSPKRMQTKKTFVVWIMLSEICVICLNMYFVMDIVDLSEICVSSIYCVHSFNV